MSREPHHTPGPWHAFISNGVIAITKGSRRSHTGAREVIKWTGFDASDYPKDAIANAFLIAAAPEMLEALRWLGRSGRLDPDASERVCSVIAKAEGWSRQAP